MIAFVFPGQGAQKVGMGESLAKTFPLCRDAFDEADAALGESLSRMCFEGPADGLRLTENTQPAILAMSIAVLRLVEIARRPRRRYAAGHSLGEYSAHVAAGTYPLRMPCAPYAAVGDTCRRRCRWARARWPQSSASMPTASRVRAARR